MFSQHAQHLHASTRGRGRSLIRDLTPKCYIDVHDLDERLCSVEALKVLTWRIAIISRVCDEIFDAAHIRWLPSNQEICLPALPCCSPAHSSHSILGHQMYRLLNNLTHLIPPERTHLLHSDNARKVVCDGLQEVRLQAVTLVRGCQAVAFLLANLLLHAHTLVSNHSMFLQQTLDLQLLSVGA